MSCSKRPLEEEQESLRNEFVDGPAAAREEPERWMQGRDANRRGDRGAAGPAAAAASSSAPVVGA